MLLADQPLLKYVAAAMLPDSDGLDIDALSRDKTVTVERLQAAIANVCEEFSMPLPAANHDDKAHLIVTLETLLDGILGNPQFSEPAREITISSSKKWVEPSDNSGVYMGSKKTSDIIAGSGLVTNRVMHAVRMAAGWKPVSKVALEFAGVTNPKITHMAVDTIHDHFIQSHMEKGLDRIAAEEYCRSSYLSIMRYFNGEREPYTDHLSLQASKSMIDLSPQAVQDFRKEYERIDSLIPRMRPKLEAFSHWHLGNKKIGDIDPVALVEELRGKEVERLVKTGCSSEQAQFITDGSYIGISQPSTWIPVTRYTLHARGLYDVEEALRQQPLVAVLLR